MPAPFPPINPAAPYLWHGGDYNPDQWLEYPDIFEQDVRLMKLAHVNVVSLGIFSWSMLEPEEGTFNFGWMDTVFDRLAKEKINVVLATPTGAKPNWMAAKYPEIRRKDPEGNRAWQWGRHNHCWTSPVYREKATIINTKLAERYGKYPNLVMWHLSNEYGGYCYCELCRGVFQEWCKQKYGTLDKLNHAWWTRFWSHIFTDWSQIQYIDDFTHGHQLDWRRFQNDQCVSFIKHEMEPLRRITPGVPCTTNMMGTYVELNYWEQAKVLDRVSWDSYPAWHVSPGVLSVYETSVGVAFNHDMYRSLMGGKPFMLMESTPSQVNWQPVSVPKRPGLHKLASLQAIAHGSDTVMYFQFRKGRGGGEKFHGAIVDHAGHEHTRIFREVAETGEMLEELTGVAGAGTRAQVALIQDWENRWAIECAWGPRGEKKDYITTCVEHYKPMYRRGVSVDVINATHALDGYKVVVAPMLYMIKPGVAEALEAFVRRGGTLVMTYMSGIADESDLVFLGGWPGGDQSALRKIFGIWVEEQDILTDTMPQKVVGKGFGLKGKKYAARHYADIIHLEGARAVATFGRQYYKGSPAVTVNAYGRGKAIWVGARGDEQMIDDLLAHALKGQRIEGVLGGLKPLPEGVSATRRSGDGVDYLFLMNWTEREKHIRAKGKTVKLGGYGVKVVMAKGSKGD